MARNRSDAAPYKPCRLFQRLVHARLPTRPHAAESRPDSASRGKRRGFLSPPLRKTPFPHSGLLVFTVRIWQGKVGQYCCPTLIARRQSPSDGKLSRDLGLACPRRAATRFQRSRGREAAKSSGGVLDAAARLSALRMRKVRQRGVPGRWAPACKETEQTVRLLRVEAGNKSSAPLT